MALGSSAAGWEQDHSRYTEVAQRESALEQELRPPSLVSRYAQAHRAELSCIVFLCGVIAVLIVYPLKPDLLPLPWRQFDAVAAIAKSLVSTPALPRLLWNTSLTEDCSAWPLCIAGAGDPLGLAPRNRRLVELPLPLSPSLGPLFRSGDAPSLPFPGANALRLSRLYALLQAGVGVAIAVTGGSMSSGHGIDEKRAEPLGGQRGAIYAGQLVQWLNEAYPVRHPHVYRHLERHVFWNLARPATPSLYTSFCLEHQLLECAQYSQGCHVGGPTYIERRRREWAAENASSTATLTIDGCPMTPQGAASAECVQANLHMPDLLFFEFSVNDNRDFLESPDPVRIFDDEHPRSEDDSVPLPPGTRAGIYQHPGPSLERLVRLLLHRADVPTAMYVVHHHFAPVANYFYSVQTRHGAVAEHYGLPTVSLRDSLWWNPFLLDVFASDQQWYDRMYETLYNDPVHLSFHGHGVLASLIKQEMRLYRWLYLDPQSPPPALYTSPPTPVPLPNISLAQLDAVLQSALTAAELAHYLPPVLHPSSDALFGAAHSTSSARGYTCRRVITNAEALEGGSLSLHVLNSTRGWVYGNRGGDKQFFLVDREQFLADGGAQLDIELARPVLSWFGLMIISSGSQVMGWVVAWLSCQYPAADEQQPWLTHSSPRFNISGLYVSDFTTEQVKEVWRLDAAAAAAPPAPCQFNRAHVRAGDGLTFKVTGYIASHADQ